MGAGWPGTGVSGLGGTPGTVEVPGALWRGGVEPGGQWVVAPGGVVGLFIGVPGLLGLTGVPGLLGLAGLFMLGGLLGVLGVPVGAAATLIAAAPSTNPDRAADRCLMTYS